MPDVIVTVSTTTLVQGSSATIVFKKEAEQDVVMRLSLRPSSAPVDIIDNNVSRGNAYSTIFVRNADRQVLFIKAFSNQDISMITRDDGSARPKPINRNTDFDVVIRPDANVGANLDYQDAGGNTIRDADGNLIKGTEEITLPFTIIATDPGIRLKIKVYLEGALRR